MGGASLYTVALETKVRPEGVLGECQELRVKGGEPACRGIPEPHLPPRWQSSSPTRLEKMTMTLRSTGLWPGACRYGGREGARPMSFPQTGPRDWDPEILSRGLTLNGLLSPPRILTPISAASGGCQSLHFASRETEAQRHGSGLSRSPGKFMVLLG